MDIRTISAQFLVLATKKKIDGAETTDLQHIQSSTLLLLCSFPQGFLTESPLVIQPSSVTSNHTNDPGKKSPSMDLSANGLDYPLYLLKLLLHLLLEHISLRMGSMIVVLVKECLC